MKVLYWNKDRKFYNKMLNLAAPIVIQNLIQSSLSFVDTLIIGGLGVTAIASVGLGNQYLFIIQVLLTGVTGGAAVFTAQLWGKKDIDNINRVTLLSLIIGILLALVLSLASFFNSSWIMSIYTMDIAVINCGASYLRFSSLSYVLLAITVTYSSVLRTMGRVKLPTIISVIALSINTVLGYILVYGMFGVHKFGAAGAGLSTLIARLIEMTAMLIIVGKEYKEVLVKFKLITTINLTLVKEFFSLTIPVVITELLWSVGISAYAIAYASIGTDAIASKNIMNTIEGLTWVVFLGVGNACAVIIGNDIGAGNERDALEHSRKFTEISVGLAVAAMVIIIILAKPIVSLFNVPEVVSQFAVKNLYVMAAFMWIRVLNFILLSGLLRSGGDTKYSMAADMISVWFVGVPLAFAAAKLWHLPVYFVYAFASVEEIAKFVFALPRVYSKKWIKNVTEAI